MARGIAAFRTPECAIEEAAAAGTPAPIACAAFYAPRASDPVRAASKLPIAVVARMGGAGAARDRFSEARGAPLAGAGSVGERLPGMMRAGEIAEGAPAHAVVEAAAALRSGDASQPEGAAHR